MKKKLLDELAESVKQAGGNRTAVSVRHRESFMSTHDDSAAA